MEKEYITRSEFIALKEEVAELKDNMNEIQKLFQAIDKKIDVIAEKINSGESVTDLKIKPLEKRIFDVEDSIKWITRIIIGLIVTAVCTIIFK